MAGNRKKAPGPRPRQTAAGPDRRNRRCGAASRVRRGYPLMRRYFEPGILRPQPSRPALPRASHP